MAELRTELRPWIHTRSCGRCGYAGWELQLEGEHAAFHCPNCDEDLYARRPLSYAEREGFVSISGPVPATPVIPLRRPLLVVRVLRGARAWARRVLRT